MELAEAFLKTGELQDALDALNQQLQEQPDDAYARRLRAQVLTRLEQPQAALNDLQALSEQTSDDVLLSVRLYEALQQPEQALATLQQAYAQKGDARLAERLWQVFMKHERYMEAADLAADQARDWRWQQLHAESLVAAGQHDEAIVDYQHALQLLEEKLPSLSDTASAHMWQAQLLLALAGCYVKRRQWEQVAVVLEKARLLTNDPIVTFYAGLSAAAQGHLSEGIQQVQAALQASSLEVRALLLHDLREYEFLQVM